MLDSIVSRSIGKKSPSRGVKPIGGGGGRRTDKKYKAGRKLA